MKYLKYRAETEETIPIDRDEVREIFSPLPHPERALEALNNMGYYSLMFFDLIAYEEWPRAKEEEAQST